MTTNKITISILIILIIIPITFSSPLSCADDTTRNYLTTGNWYPPDKNDLDKILNRCFMNAKTREIPGKIVGLIAPHAGIEYAGRCSANAYIQLTAQADKIERVFLFGVSHRGGFSGACVSSFAYNSTPSGKIPEDQTVTAALAKEKYFRVDNRIMQYEHSIENHLPFLQKALKDGKYKIVPILFGYLREKDFQLMADIIKKYIDDKTLVIASTDFTHYGSNFGYLPFKEDIKNNLTKLDMGIINPILKLDFDNYSKYEKKTGITMCGFIPVGVLLKIFSDGKHKGMLLDYYKSGDAENDYSLSVSYASIIITGKTDAPPGIKKKETNRSNPMELNKEEKKTLLVIARDSLEKYINEHDRLEDIETKYKLSEKLKEKAGVFVTLRIKDQLRGCIGSLVGTTALYKEVSDNAVNSAVNDPRFPAVKSDELKKIDLEISVMTPLQKIDDYKKIRLGIDGVIIKMKSSQAVFLPQVATETGWNLDEFLSHLCQKAWLPADAYKSPAMEFFIFQAQVFGEEELHK